MNYPSNRLIVNDVDITSKWGLILADGFTLSPPAPKTYTVDIPGGNGCIDLTESLLGDTAYENRKQEFTFYLVDTTKFETVKTELSNFLHGKRYSYQMTMDPGYTYKGRFTINSYSHSMYSSGKLGYFVISVEAEPFKYSKDAVYMIDAVGGTTVYLKSGRMRVRPTIETDGYLKVIHNNQLTVLPQGTWTINNLLFTDGLNELYLNSYDIRNLTWKNLKDENVTWGTFKTKRLYEWYKSKGDGTFVMKTWGEMSNDTWSSLSDTSWGGLRYLSSSDQYEIDVKDVYVKYEVGDL